MGIFKKLGTKLKRVVSIKNLVHGVTGNFGAIAKDAVRVATTEGPKKNSSGVVVDAGGVDTTFLKPNYQIPAPALDVIEGQGKAFGAKVATAVGSQTAVQGASAFFTKVYLESMYNKYKTWITLFFALVGAFILYKVLRKPNTKTRARGRR
jgi:hypothetical protein